MVQATPSIRDALQDGYILVQQGQREVLARPAGYLQSDRSILAGTTAPDQTTDTAKRQKLYIDWAIVQAENARVFTEAIRLLCQNPYGQELLQAAHREKISFAYYYGVPAADEDGDSKVVRAKLEQLGHPDACFLMPGADAVQTALSIVQRIAEHQFSHSNERDVAAGLTWNAHDNLATALKLDYAKAAAGVAAAARVTYSMGQIADGYFKPEGFEATFARQFPEVASTVRSQGRVAAQSGSWNGFMRAAFQAYYRESRLLGAQNHAALTFFTKCLQRIQRKHPAGAERDKSLKAFMSDDRPCHEKIVARLPYLVGTRMKFDDKRWVGLGPYVQVQDKNDKLRAAMTEAGIPAAEVARRLDLSSFGKDVYLGEQLQLTAFQSLALRILGVAKQLFPFGTLAASPVSPTQLFVLPEAEAEKPIPIALQTFAERVKQRPSDLDICSHIATIFDGSDAVQYVPELLSAGFRAPIDAFPQPYIFDLLGKIRGASQRGFEQNTLARPGLSVDEISLLTHWRGLARAGVSPLVDANRKHVDGRLNNWMRELVSAFDVKTPPVDPSAVVTLDGPHLAQWASRHSPEVGRGGARSRTSFPIAAR